MAAALPLLSLMLLLPLAGIALLLAAGGDPVRQRRIALGCSLLVLALAALLGLGFDQSLPGYQFQERAAWLPGIGSNYHLGVDGLSVLLVLLTAAMTPLAILAAWSSPRPGLRGELIALLALETLLLGVFSAIDLLVFYLCFEAAMVPVFLLIGTRGGPGRSRAAMKLFLYTLAGMLLTLLGLLALWQRAGSTDLPALLRLSIPAGLQDWLFLAFLAGFGVKLPLWPLHTWQPDAYAEAPTSASVMLGGVMLTMGGYGLLRIAIPLLPQAAQHFAPLVFALAVMGVLHASLVALAQQDLKRLIAYASVAHMGLIAAGLFAGSPLGLSGALLQMLSHGVVTGALFLLVGMLQERGVRLGGLAGPMPRFAVLLLLFTMAALALPGTGDFPGELLVLLAAWKVSPWLALGLATTLVLSAAYMLPLYRRVALGPAQRGGRDLSGREAAMLAPLAVLTLWMGLHPNSFLGFFEHSVSALVARQEAALAVARLSGL